MPLRNLRNDPEIQPERLAIRVIMAIAVILFIAAFTRANEPPVALLDSPPAAQVAAPTPDPSAACVRVSWKQWSASGTCIASEDGKSLILTCNHLFYEQPYAGAPFQLGAYPLTSTVTVRGKTYTATAIAGDADADLALVEVDAVLPVADIAPELPQSGSKVQHYGLGSGGGVGKVLPVPTNVSRPSMMFLYDAKSDSGDSGAGVFDEFGRLCAVHCGRDGTARSSPSRGTPVTSVRVVVKQHTPRLFSRLRARLESRKSPAATMVYPEPPAAVVPPKKVELPKKVEYVAPPTVYYYPSVDVNVSGGGCANGQCPLPSSRTRVGVFGRIR